MPRKHKTRSGHRAARHRVGGGSMIQSGILKYRLNDFVDYEVPPPTPTPVPDIISQYGIAPFNTIPGMFGTSDDLKKVSLPACRPLRMNLSVLPPSGVPNSEASTFTVRSACPIAYPTLAGSTNPQITAAWNQQTTLVTPNVNPTFIRVATWDFRAMPQGTVFQTATDVDETKAVMGLVNFQVLDINSDTQFASSNENLKILQFRIELDFELPMPALSQIRNSYRVKAGENFFTDYDKDSRAGDSNVYLIVEGMRRTVGELPGTNSIHGRMAVLLNSIIKPKGVDEAGRKPRVVQDHSWDCHIGNGPGLYPRLPTAPPLADTPGKSNFVCGCVSPQP